MGARTEVDLVYVCSCFGITEQQVREHAESGACTPRQIASASKAGTDCGSCVRRIQGLLGRGGCPRRAAGPEGAERLQTESRPAPSVDDGRPEPAARPVPVGPLAPAGHSAIQERSEPAGSQHAEQLAPAEPSASAGCAVAETSDRWAAARELPTAVA